VSRGRTTPQKNADVASHAGRAIGVEMLFDSGALRIAIAQKNLSDGTNTYTATGLAFAMSEVQESSAGFEGFEVSLSGLDAGIQSIIANEPYRGRIISVLEQRFDANDVEVGNLTRQVVGRMRAMVTETVTKDGKQLVAIQAEHFDAELDDPRTLRFTDADQKRRYPTDLGAEYLSALLDRVITRNRG
jgi:hypothetical protein